MREGVEEDEEAERQTEEEVKEKAIKDDTLSPAVKSEPLKMAISVCMCHARRRAAQAGRADQRYLPRVCSPAVFPAQCDAAIRGETGGLQVQNSRVWG